MNWIFTTAIVIGALALVDAGLFIYVWRRDRTERKARRSRALHRYVSGERPVWNDWEGR